MAELKDERSQIGTSLAWGVPPAFNPFNNPMMAIIADLNGTVLEGVTTAQKDWAEFVQQRAREDVAVSRQILNCHSLADVHQVYSQFLQTAFQQYREQLDKAVQRSESIAQHLAETTEAQLKEAARARH